MKKLCRKAGWAAARWGIFMAVLAYASWAYAQPPDSYSEHREQMEAVEKAKAAQALAPAETPAALPESEAAPEAAPSSAGRVRSAASPSIDTKRFVVFGYAQNDYPAAQYPWHALTHVAAEFVSFNSSGGLSSTSGWTSRAAELKPGGAADRYGVKVIMTLMNSGFDTTTLNTVMQSTTLRQTLITNLKALIAQSGSSNCAGVNLDFEPAPFASATGAGITQFVGELKTAIAPLEVSIYLGPTYSSRYDLAQVAASVDFIDFSCYPWSGSWNSYAQAVAPQNRYQEQVDAFIANGCPPEKIVLALPSYGYAMVADTAAYGATKSSNIGSVGYVDMKFQTVLLNPPRERFYHSPSESVWFAVANGAQFNMYNYDDEDSLRVKMNAAKHWVGAENTGRRLGGVGFWSLMWMAGNPLGSFTSRDIETGASVSKTRTYPQIYQAVQELFAPPGVREYAIERWEEPSNFDARWRSPTEGSDGVGVVASGTSRAVVATPSGAGKPANSSYCMRLNFSFTATAGNQLFFGYEILGHNTYTTTPDRLSAKGFFDSTTKVLLDCYAASAYSGRTIRMILMDAKGQLEMGPPNSLATAGWRTLSWDLNEAGSATAYVTKFKQYNSGDGLLDTAGAGARDLAFIGVLIQGGGAAGAGSVYLDELRYTQANPGGREYLINEFRYAETGRHFVEIRGTAGAFPAGLEARVVEGAEGTISRTIPLGGYSIADAGGGAGYFVIAESAADGANLTIAADFLLAGIPSAIQLFDPTTQVLYDSVAYRTFGGLGGLDGPGDPIVTDNGPSWLGEAALGYDAANATYSFGRSPDGANSYINGADFALMTSTPGKANQGADALPESFDFETPPAGALQTYRAISLQNPADAGVPAMQGQGKAWRCVDTAGGGVIGMMGGPSLGADGSGYSASGFIYLPAAAEPAQAVAVGICGRQGSTFFTSSPAGSGHEGGYWLIYMNQNVTMNDGQANHPGAFDFIYATNDNQDAEISLLLGNATRQSLGAAEGAWAPFYLSINPGAPAPRRLIAALNNQIVYAGDVPEGGPLAGAFQVGFRENHTGSPTAREGAWIDNVRLDAPYNGIQITRPPENRVASVGARVEFSVETGSGLGQVSFQWNKDESPIEGATQATYAIDAAQLSDAGVYSVVVSDALTSVESEGAVLDVLGNASGRGLIAH